MEIFLPQTINVFQCEKCDFITSNKKDYKRHISSVKHIRRVLETGASNKWGKNLDFTQQENALKNQVFTCKTLQHKGVGGGGVGGGCDANEAIGGGEGGYRMAWVMYVKTVDIRTKVRVEYGSIRSDVLQQQ